MRRYSAVSTEFPPTFFIDSFITAAKNLKPAIHILGKPFVDQYVASYTKFTEDEGAIAIRFGDHLKWVPYSIYVPDPPKVRTFEFRHGGWRQ